MKFDVEAARKAGYTDSEIAEFLARDRGFDLPAALNAGYSHGDIIGFLAEGKKQAPEEPIDDRTGAGWRERYIIGSASDNKTRFARAKAIWGDDAKMDKDGRISFTNPETGRRTYVNPSGLDWGDVPGVGREIASTVASIPATVAGALLSGPGALVAGSAAGAAAGQGADAAAAAWARAIARERGNPVPEMQSPIDAAKEAGLETAFGIGGGALLGGAGRLVRGALNPMNQSYVSAFKNIGMDIPTVGTGAGTKGAAIYENGLGSMMGGIGTMDAASQRAQAQLTKALVEKANKMAGGIAAETPTELGDTAVRAAKSSLNDFRAANNKWYGEFQKEWGNAPASLSNTEKTIFDLTYGRGLADETAKAEANSLLAMLGNEATDAANGNLNVATLQNLRTRIGQMLQSPSAMQTAGVEEGKLRAIYRSLSDDYAAAITDPAARQAYLDHKAWEAGQYAARERLAPIFDVAGGDPTQVGKRLMSTSLTPRQVDDMSLVLGKDFGKVSGGILRNAGQDLSSNGVEGVVSPSQLSKVLTPGRGQSYQPETITKLWGDEVKDLGTAANALSVGGRNANASKTAQTNAMVKAIDTVGGSPLRLLQSGSLAGGGISMYSGGGPAGLIGAGMSVATPWALSKLTTNPTLIRYLAKPQSTLSKAVFNSPALPALGIDGGILTRFNAEK